VGKNWFQFARTKWLTVFARQARVSIELRYQIQVSKNYFQFGNQIGNNFCRVQSFMVWRTTTLQSKAGPASTQQNVSSMVP